MCGSRPGPSSEGGLQLRSFRTKDGLESWVSFPAKYSAFPGILNGGLITTAFECQGNWTAAVALMDRSSLPKPPMTLTAELLVSCILSVPLGTSQQWQQLCVCPVKPLQDKAMEGAICTALS